MFVSTCIRGVLALRAAFILFVDFFLCVIGELMDLCERKRDSAFSQELSRCFRPSPPTALTAFRPVFFFTGFPKKALLACRLGCSIGISELSCRKNGLTVDSCFAESTSRPRPCSFPCFPFSIHKQTLENCEKNLCAAVRCAISDCR